MIAIIDTFHRPKWRSIVLITLAFWLSGSLLLDLVIMPGLFASGMMTEPGFAAAGYSIFGVFNRVELLCAAIALTGILILRTTEKPVSRGSYWATPLSLGLLAIALIYTYVLTPEMCALGIHLNLFESTAIVPALMDQMHGEYWGLELFKLVATSALLILFYRNRELSFKKL
ncbi:MAG: DUF4149 domain-containing protein [Cyanobacteria bacterium CRU_2_1]|nr:DUF4149 domain-containing protein [Cyanobacteria bacterium RU_5_0]NJR60620.1 DUF4149 domain-containing protein [Cyanobacteria bacterium CRU_2_1]